MSTIYGTSHDAIEQAIVPALGDHADDFDVEAIFAECFAYQADSQGFVQVVDTDTFWTVAFNHTEG